jgi:hypothetical protein
VVVADAVDEAERQVAAARHRLPKTRNENMVLTKEELISALQNEVRILLHLASKVDRNQLDYRPTPKQRSTIELLRYLTIMGPNLIPAIKTGTFDGAAFGASQAAANAMNFDQVLAAIGKQSAYYAHELGSMPDADFRSEIDMFGRKSSRGSHIVFVALCGFAAYRTQLFLYLKACGRDELNTMNLWGGADGPMQG